MRRALALGATRVAVNVQVPPARAVHTDTAAVHAVLAPFRAELGLPADPAPASPPDPPLVILRAALEAGATIASVALGNPGPAAELAREAGVPLLAMVTTPTRRCAAPRPASTW